MTQQEKGLFIIRQIRNHLLEMMFHAEENNMSMVKKKIKDIDAMLSIVKKIHFCPMESDCPMLNPDSIRKEEKNEF